MRDRSERLAAAFLAEPHDAAWAKSAAGALRRTLAGNAVSPRIKGASIDCRSRTCRIELANAPAELSESLPRLALRMAGDFPSVSVGQGERPSGRAVTWIYLSR